MPCRTRNKSLVEFHKVQYYEPLLFLFYINYFNNSSNQLDFHLFADDSNLFYANQGLLDLETKINELQEVFSWRYANILSLNIERLTMLFFAHLKN